MYARRKGKGGPNVAAILFSGPTPPCACGDLSLTFRPTITNPNSHPEVESMFETSGWKLGCASINHSWRMRRRQNPLPVDGKEQVAYKWSWSTAIPGASAMGISITCNARLTSLVRGIDGMENLRNCMQSKFAPTLSGVC
jgi:hypothetical protein